MTVPMSLAGRRILVVEDDMMIAVLIEEVLQELGCVVVGPVGKLDAALHLAGSEVFPVAERLRIRGIPFVLASGYGDWALPEAFRRQPRLTKPFTYEELEAQMRLLFSVQEGGRPTLASPA